MTDERPNPSTSVDPPGVPSTPVSTLLAPSPVLLSAAVHPAVFPLHGAVRTPVPHWVVLLGAVPALWLLVAAVVVAVDRLHRRVRRSESAD
jgi:hypothetical protein